jgi:multidrug efflux pump subunit AcrA (membrane-fusion protein)
VIASPSAASAPSFLRHAPPAWAARSLAWVLLATFAAGALMLVVVQVPETVAAPFVVVAEHGADPVRTLHDGILTSVRVADAQPVEAGAILFTIGSEPIGDRTAERIALGTSLAGGERRLANEGEKYENERQAQEQERIRLQQRLDTLATQTTFKQHEVEIAREIARRQQLSHEEGLTSWIEASKPRLEAERLAVELEQVRADVVETKAAIARVHFEMASRRAAFDEIARSVREELQRARTRKSMLDGEAAREGNALTIAAPCAGTIVKLVAKNAGTVVRSSDVLAEIACRDERLQAELLVPQRGLARLRPGQLVKLRYDAFPYQRFGVRYATLHWISPTASLQSGGDGAFRAIARLDVDAPRIGSQPLAVLPGMAGQASIVVGRRTLASYLTEPLRAIRDTLSTERGSSERGSSERPAPASGDGR